VNELDEIMSGAGEAMPETQQEQPSQPRDESGRFATAETPVVEPPAVVEEPAQEEHPTQGGIPAQRLKAEADKRREAEASAEALRREVAELRGWITGQQKPAAEPQPEQQPASLWDDPENFLKGQLSPVQREIAEMREMFWEGQAAQLHGADKIQAAKAAAEALDQNGKANLHRQLMAGGNPFDNLVKWHKQQEALSRVGDDPDAWLNAEIEKKLADPAFLASAIERARAGASNPTARSQPITNLPPSLNRLPAGGNQAADNDMSDGALFSNAMR
jgi:hypothetical protein